MSLPTAPIHHAVMLRYCKKVFKEEPSVTIMCRNDELSWLFSNRFLFAEISQILLKIHFIPILLIFMYLLALYQVLDADLLYFPVFVNILIRLSS